MERERVKSRAGPELSAFCRPGRALGVAALLVLVAGAGAAVVYVLRATANPVSPASPSAAGAATPGGVAAVPGAGAKPMDAASVDAVLNAAQTYLNNGETGKAEAVLTQAIAEHADEQRLYIQLAELLTGQRRLGEAYDRYIQALAIGPRDAATEFAAGTVASMTGKLDRAVEHYSAAQVANPSDYRAPLFLGQVQLKMGERDEAKKNLLLAAKLKPDAAAAWGTLADVALGENKADLALQHIAKARQIEPRVLVWRLIEARALKRQGKAEEALALVVNLDEAQKRQPGVIELIAECYGMLARPADAAALYAGASDAEPGDGKMAFEAAAWFERAKDSARGLMYAKRAAALKVQGAEGLVSRLGG